ncbi:hypothetical protein A6F68_01925 [Tsuneonella dongtanensis]|uniref:Uncharacterized protein n=1 Tax=Tsuneonella dongtanensis TaxID=692370 RepID=A0A1B2AE64_9SPHN|nr:hypothetical protein [Tsuneonella dongtanensis]ANY20434.1 hypothetical protein A6F68_01925 [Tsuneonella dongtanensis]
MLRRILACLAILTGLTTVGTPAQARMMAVMSQSVVEGAQSAPGNPVTACDRRQQRQELRSKVATLPPCKPPKPVVIVIPTIQLGPDRALE